MVFGDRLKKLRSDKGYSLRQLAKITGIPHSTYVHMEKGVRVISIDNLVRLSLAYGGTQSWLIEMYLFYCYMNRGGNSTQDTSPMV